MSVFSHPEDKERVRKQMSAMLSSLTVEQHRDRSAQVAANVIELLSSMDRPLVMAAYMPYRQEVDIMPVLEYGWQHHIRVILPRSVPSTRQLRFYYVNGMQDIAPETGAYGIREPREQAIEWNDQHALDLVLVPGLAVDTHFFRLGYGGGYYDRWLSRQAECRSIKPSYIFPAFELQTMRVVPTEPHDIPMDVMVTERQVRFRDGVVP